MAINMKIPPTIPPTMIGDPESAGSLVVEWDLCFFFVLECLCFPLSLVSLRSKATCHRSPEDALILGWKMSHDVHIMVHLPYRSFLSWNLSWNARLTTWEMTFSVIFWRAFLCIQRKTRQKITVKGTCAVSSEVACGSSEDDDSAVCRFSLGFGSIGPDLPHPKKMVAHKKLD